MSLPFSLKAGVDPTGVTQELLSALGVAQGIYSSFGQPFTVTSLTEGQHVTNSKHYIGQAADLRTNGVDPATVPQIAQTLQSQLGSNYYVLQESDHIHVQYNGVGTASDSLLPTDTGLPADSGGLDLSAILGSVDSSGAFQASSVDWTTVGLVGLGLVALWWMFSD